MAQVNGIKVAGLNKAIRALKEIGVPNAEVQAAGTAAAEIVASTSRTLVPVKSGKLLRSIRTAKQLRKAIVRAGNNGKVPYANPIHWGWFYDRENFVYKNILPQPFFTKALGLTRDQVYKTYVANIEKLLNKYKKY